MARTLSGKWMSYGVNGGGVARLATAGRATGVGLLFGAAVMLLLLRPRPVFSDSPATQPSGPTAATSPADVDNKADGELITAGPLKKASITEHELKVDDGVIKYRATAAEMPLMTEEGELKATMFFVAYEQIEAGETAPSERPLTFIFNGGPGAAAVWLHLGVAGPRRIGLDDQGEPTGPPYHLEDNPNTWLAYSDLVFVDPVGTGFSRPAKGEKGSQFYGVEEDIRWVSEFIRLYITRYERWLSPKFLAGESYGGTRVAALARYLARRFGVALNGVMLISPALEFQTLSPDGGNDLPYALYLPSYAAVAWYHQKLEPALQANLADTLDEAAEWAIETYLPALAQGDRLSGDRREAVVTGLSRFTSLSEDFIRRSNLRVDPGAFRKRLLNEKSQLIGRFDGRIVGFDPNPAESWTTYDPSLTRYFSAYSSTFNDYVRRDLKYVSDLPYELLSDRVHPWDFGENGQGYLSVSDDLQAAIVRNHRLKVLVAAGYFDLATPYAATDYTIHRLALSPALRSNIRQTYYHGGHMMYHDLQSLKQLTADVEQLLRDAVER